MATARQFEDLKVWQDARQVVGAIYAASKPRGFQSDSSLRDQIRRAAISTMSNIAEGFDRGTRKEFIQFLNIAKGSNGEVRSQLCIALDQKYIGETEFTALQATTLSLSKQLAAFIRYLEGYPKDARVKPAARSRAQTTSNQQPATSNP
jgi:four helix bundle protein